MPVAELGGSHRSHCPPALRIGRWEQRLRNACVEPLVCPQAWPGAALGSASFAAFCSSKGAIEDGGAIIAAAVKLHVPWYEKAAGCVV